MRRVKQAHGLALVVVLALGAMTGCNQDRAIATQRMNEGLGELRAGRTADAVKKLEEATMKDPTYADPPYYLAQVYHQKYEQVDDAIRYYGMALERAPGNPQFHYRYGTVLAAKGRHNEAIGEFQSAVGAHEKFPKAWFRLGLSQLALNQYVDGVSSLTKSIQLDARMRIGHEDPGGAAYHALGDLYLRFGFYDKALKVYENGILNNPDVAQLYRGRGVAQLKLKRFPDAEASFKKAIEMDPGSAPSYFNLALAQREQKQYKAALESIERFLLKADPVDDQVRMAAAGGMRSELMAEMDRKK